jgi:hypothetical protein
MDTKFDFSTMEKVLQKAAKDKTGELSSLINDLILIGRKAGRSGFDLQEIASVVTMGYFVSREPELESLIQFLLSKTQPDDFIN